MPRLAPSLKPPGCLRHVPQGPRSERKNEPRRQAARQTPPSWARIPPPPASAPRPPRAMRPTSSRRRYHSFFRWALPSWDQVHGGRDGGRSAVRDTLGVWRRPRRRRRDHVIRRAPPLLPVLPSWGRGLEVPGAFWG